MNIRRVLLAFSCILAGGIVELLIYRGAIVPRLAGWQAIPAVWYPALAVPLIVGFLVAGLVLRSWSEAVLTAFPVALLALLPGGHDTDPGLNVGLSFVLTAGVLTLIVTIGQWIRHRRAPV